MKICIEFLTFKSCLFLFFFYCCCYFYVALSVRAIASDLGEENTRRLQQCKEQPKKKKFKISEIIVFGFLLVFVAHIFLLSIITITKYIFQSNPITKGNSTPNNKTDDFHIFFFFVVFVLRCACILL